MHDSAYFRRHGAHCRELASSARDEVSRRQLNALAQEMDEEADKIDAEEASRATKE